MQYRLYSNYKCYRTLKRTFRDGLKKYQLKLALFVDTLPTLVGTFPACVALFIFSGILASALD